MKRGACRVGHGAKRSQRGATILVTIVFLTLISFVVMTSYKLSGQQLALAGNVQSRSQVLAAANYAIEETLSSLDFVKQPDLVAQKKIQVDVLGGGLTRLEVSMTRPTCYRLKPVKTKDLDLAKAGDRACLATSSQAGAMLVEGGASTNGGDSLCTDTEWALAASVTDTAVTQSSLAVNQGVAMRVDQVDAATNCTI